MLISSSIMITVKLHQQLRRPTSYYTKLVVDLKFLGIVHKKLVTDTTHYIYQITICRNVSNFEHNVTFL